MLATMRQLEERQVEHEIRLMEWSPKMDIIAVGFANGDVSLYRLNWQRLWTCSLPAAAKDEDGQEDRGCCQAISWRPDGKVLAVAYTGGQIILLDIESNLPIHTIQNTGKGSGGGSGGVSCLSWLQISAATEKEKKLPSSDDKSASPSKADRIDSHWDFLTRFPSLSKAYSSYAPSGGESGSHDDVDKDDCRKVDDGGIVTLLISGTENGEISLYFNGFLLCAKINLNLMTSQGGRVLDVTLNADLQTYSVLCQGQQGRLKVAVLTLPLIASCYQELAVLSQKFSVLEGMTNYMSETLKQISEAWEGILLEMDTKLACYNSSASSNNGSDEAGANNPGNCTMAADFLELLTFGTPSPDLEAFLLQELTEKGLKKLGHSIEVSYSNVQRLVLKYLHTVSQSINFHLFELIGLIRANEKYSVMLGVSEGQVVEAAKKAASFWSKGIELQQVIDESMKSFKAFFRWLYVEILRLSDEEISEELGKISQQDIRYIADFLDSFAPPEETTPAGGESRQQQHPPKTLERVGQYLKEEPLVQTVDRTKNPWHQFLRENADLFKDIPFIVKVNENASLLQEYASLKSAMCNLLENMNFGLTNKCVLQGELFLNDATKKSDDATESDAINDAAKTTLAKQFQHEDKIHGYAKTEAEKRLFYYEIESQPSVRMRAVFLSFERPNSSAAAPAAANACSSASAAAAAAAAGTSSGTTTKLRHASSGSQIFSPQSSSSAAASSGPINLVDCKFYTNEILSLLVSEDRSSSSATAESQQQQLSNTSSQQQQSLIQLSLADLQTYLKEVPLSKLAFNNSVSSIVKSLKTVSVLEVCGGIGSTGSHRELERIHSVEFAVSVRKVAAFLFRNRKRIRIYDMDIEEEDADDDEDDDDFDEDDEENEVAGLSSSELNTSV